VSGWTASERWDRYTVEGLAHRGFTPFVSVLAVGHAKIVPKDLAESQGEAFRHSTRRHRALQVSRAGTGKEITLVANPDYYGGAPALARVLYRIFPGESSDQTAGSSSKQPLKRARCPGLPEQVGNPRYLHVQRPTFSVRFYGFNTRFKAAQRPCGSGWPSRMR